MTQTNLKINLKAGQIYKITDHTIGQTDYRLIAQNPDIPEIYYSLDLSGNILLDTTAAIIDNIQNKEYILVANSLKEFFNK